MNAGGVALGPDGVVDGGDGGDVLLGVVFLDVEQDLLVLAWG